MFSMASMTDVIFLLLIFFMVTSTFVFPSAIEVNLPQSSEQTAIKPTTRIYIKGNGEIWGQQSTETTQGDTIRIASPQALMAFMQKVKDSGETNPATFIALHADEAVPYGKIVEVLDMGTQVGIKVVLATKPSTGNYQAPDAAAQAQAPELPAQEGDAATVTSTTAAPAVNGTTTVTTTAGDATPAPAPTASNSQTTVTVH